MTAAVFAPPTWGLIALNVGVWLGWSLLVGYGVHRIPASRFAHDNRLTRPRRFERNGHWYQDRLAIMRWKDRLPELGALFSGGFAKRAVHRDRAHLERFVVETRRAEMVHWVAMAPVPVFALWNPPWAVAVMAVYALGANLPCLLVQRYNRLRLVRVLARRPTP